MWAMIESKMTNSISSNSIDWWRFNNGSCQRPVWHLSRRWNNCRGTHFQTRITRKRKMRPWSPSQAQGRYNYSKFIDHWIPECVILLSTMVDVWLWFDLPLCRKDFQYPLVVCFECCTWFYFIQCIPWVYSNAGILNPAFTSDLSKDNLIFAGSIIKVMQIPQLRGVASGATLQAAQKPSKIADMGCAHWTSI